MNFRRANHDARYDIESDESLRPVLRDLEALYRTPATVPDFDVSALLNAPVQPIRTHPTRTRRFWKPAVALAAIALVAVAAIVIPLQLNGGTEQVNAQEILKRAAVAANTPGISYHLVETAHPTGPQGVNQTTEVWFEDSSHLHVEERWISDGKPVVLGAIASGDDTWWYGTHDGSTRALHGGKGSAMNVPQFDAVGSSIAAILNMYNSQCQAVSVKQGSIILGRKTYLLVVTAAPKGCTEESDLDAMQIAQWKHQVIRIWVDSETFVVLRQQNVEEGAVSYSSIATEFETSVQLPASTFIYAPPPGAAVIQVHPGDKGLYQLLVGPASPTPTAAATP